MRKKEPRLIITFHTTSDAMSFEAYAKEEGLRGRLIPVPREISAGCGMAWSAPTTEAEAFKKHLEDAGLSCQEIRECLV